MRKRVTWVLIVVTVVAGSAFADDRLAVFEMFGRTGCGNCNAAGEVVTVLQDELRGRAVLLEYDYDLFLYGRLDRFWATGVSAYYLPLMMVGSGYRTSSGIVDFDAVYRSMIDDELARGPRAAVTAYWRRVGDSMRAYVDVRNLGPTDLEVRRDAGIWLIAYENADTGNTGTWVQSTSVWYLPYDVEPGEGITGIIDTPPVGGLNWVRMSGLVLVEDRPAGGAYDMLQAAEALPADLYLAPERPVVGARGGTAALELAGPHVMSWTAESEVPWLVIEPSSGTLPATVSVELRPELRPAAATEGTISFTASGDGISFSTTSTVTVGPPLRRGDRRIAPHP
ncbi:MAG TPA: hypothetical protein VLT81_14345 [Chondromyces sp.]|nr:hypothetical protein [Chondromyces sp.]